MSEEFRDLGHGVSFAVVVAHGRLSCSPSWLQLRHAAVAASANGLVERQTNFIDIGEVRAAAQGLAEDRG